MPALVLPYVEDDTPNEETVSTPVPTVNDDEEMTPLVPPYVEDDSVSFKDEEWVKKIMPRPDQVWNADEVGFDPNGSWLKIICTYLWCLKEKVWTTQTGE